MYIEILCKTPKTRSKNIITPLGNRLGTYYALQNQIKDVVDMIEHMYIRIRNSISKNHNILIKIIM